MCVCEGERTCICVSFRVISALWRFGPDSTKGGLKGRGCYNSHPRNVCTPVSSSGNFLLSSPILSSSPSLSVIPSSLRWQVEGGGNARCTPGLFLWKEDERNRERETGKRERERELVLEVVLCIIGLFIQFLLHRCVCTSMCARVCLCVR